MTNFQLHKIFQVSGDDFLFNRDAPVHKDFVQTDQKSRERRDVRILT